MGAGDERYLCTYANKALSRMKFSGNALNFSLRESVELSLSLF